MTEHFPELHQLLSRTSQEYRRGLHEIIGAPVGDSPASLCDHLFFLCEGAAGHALDRPDYKQLVTDIADKVRLDWSSVVGQTSWSDLSSVQIEAAIVRHVDADQIYREEAPSQPPDAIAALDDAFSSLSGDWRKLLAAVIYIHQVIRPSAPAAVETSIKPEPALNSNPGQTEGGNGTVSAARNHRLAPPERKSGEEPLRSRAGNLGPALLDFWRWSASDLASDSVRGALAVYIVSCALSLKDGLRAEGEAADLLLHPNGLRVRVSSTADSLSSGNDDAAAPEIRFSIRSQRSAELGGSVLAMSLQKQADAYVFCLLASSAAETLDPLDVSQWRFYVVPSSVLEAQFPLGRSIGLPSLRALAIDPIEYEQLSGNIAALSSSTAGRSPEGSRKAS